MPIGREPVGGRTPPKRPTARQPVRLTRKVPQGKAAAAGCTEPGEPMRYLRMPPIAKAGSGEQKVGQVGVAMTEHSGLSQDLRRAGKTTPRVPWPAGSGRGRDAGSISGADERRPGRPDRAAEASVRMLLVTTK